MDYEQIIVERRGRVALVTLNRPAKLNAWTPRMMTEYRNAIEHANADPDIGSIVMTGAGRAFCAGADIGEVFNTTPTLPTGTGHPEDFRMIDFLTFAGVNPASRGQ